MISSYQHLVSVSWRCIYHLLQSSQCFLNGGVPHICNVYFVGVDFKVHLDAQKSCVTEINRFLLKGYKQF
jgi:hypothetical protein